MLLPIGLETSLSRFPRVTFTLIGLCLLVFALQTLFTATSQERMVDGFTQYLLYYSKVTGAPPPPELIQALREKPPEELYRLFKALSQAATPNLEEQTTLDRLANNFLQGFYARPIYRFGFRPGGPWINLWLSLFLHAGLLHLLGNMLLLYLVGIKLEDLWGGWVVLAMFLLGGATASLTHAAFSHSSAPLIGASGAIAALMGAFLVRLYQIRVRMFALVFLRPVFFTWPAYVVLLLWFLQEVLTVVTGTSGNVATWAHLGGFGFGVLAAFALRVSPLDARLLTPEQQRAERKEFQLLDEAQTYLETGFASQAIPKFRAYLAVQPKDAGAWENLAKALRMNRQDPREAAFKAVAEWLELGRSEHAKHLLQDFNLKPDLRQALQIHTYLEPQEGRKLLQEQLMSTPQDPYAPKAALLWNQRYPQRGNLETLQWVYEYTSDPDWQDRLKKEIQQLAAGTEPS